MEGRHTETEGHTQEADKVVTKVHTCPTSMYITAVFRVETESSACSVAERTEACVSPHADLQPAL